MPVRVWRAMDRRERRSQARETQYRQPPKTTPNAYALRRFSVLDHHLLILGTHLAGMPFMRASPLHGESFTSRSCKRSYYAFQNRNARLAARRSSHCSARFRCCPRGPSRCPRYTGLKVVVDRRDTVVIDSQGRRALVVAASSVAVLLICILDT